MRDGALDAITVAFGVRNLRPRRDALAELARVLRPGGTLAVLEAAAPSSGPFAGPHGFYLRHVIPLAGRLSPEPSAYVYLSRSIFEFGDGAEFERDLAQANFTVLGRRRFLLGATRLWVAERAGAGQIATGAGRELQNARPPGGIGVNRPTAESPGETEWRVWTAVQAVLAAALTVTMG